MQAPGAHLDRLRAKLAMAAAEATSLNGVDAPVSLLTTKRGRQGALRLANAGLSKRVAMPSIPSSGLQSTGALRPRELCCVAEVKIPRVFCPKMESNFLTWKQNPSSKFQAPEESFPS